MNKKRNTVYFLIGATILNLLIMGIMFILLTVLISWISGFIGEVSDTLYLVGGILFLVIWIGGTFFIYNRIIKWVVQKWDLERYIEPVFKGRRRR